MKKCKYILCLCVSFMLTGCGMQSSAQVETDHAVTELSQFPGTYRHKGENVIFDTQVVIEKQGEENHVYSGKATLQPIAYTKLKTLLMGKDGITEYKDKLNNYFGDKYIAYTYVKKDKTTLDIGFHNASYITPFVNYVNAAFHPLEEDEKYNGDLYVAEKELPDFSRQEAFNLLKDTLHNIQADIPEEYVSYTLDHEMMRREEVWEDETGNEISEEKKDAWTKEDDAYYFALRQRICGISEIHSYYYDGLYDDSTSMPVEAIVSRRGVEELLIERLFDYEMEEKPLALKPFDEIAASIEYNLSQAIGVDPFLVTKAQLLYYEQLTGKDEYKVIPVWLISYEQQIDGESFHYLNIYDAVTGKEITV